MDNVFLIRDIIDIGKTKDLNVGLLSIDQQKAFDRVDHNYLFKTMGAFGFPTKFISWMETLYEGATVLLRVGGGLSRPVEVKRGIRQGCPLSGMLYVLAIEPLLRKLSRGLRGLRLEQASQPLCLSAYADDITVIISGQEDVETVQQSLSLYERASSAQVNWSKSEAYLLGQWEHQVRPVLPGGLQWSIEGFKCLGVFLGSEQFRTKNWDGLVEKVSARLSRWAWVQPQLSYRGRALVANTLAASCLWHRFTILQPPDSVVADIQKRLVDFFWGGYHWLKAAVLYLPVEEGGQGLVDISSRLAALRLWTAKRFLYGPNNCGQRRQLSCCSEWEDCVMISTCSSWT
ncbi:hypothetical protein NQD34_007854 [Periophthalmus magnuspinnatus]|nr:hypothetical protein NQD34_007854 [Periophthalmus magnuspinnatus]